MCGQVRHRLTDAFVLPFGRSRIFAGDVVDLCSPRRDGARQPAKTEGHAEAFAFSCRSAIAR
jgi:hypothetical protein